MKICLQNLWCQHILTVMAEEDNEIRGGGNSVTCRLNQAKLISISNLTV